MALSLFPIELPCGTPGHLLHPHANPATDHTKSCSAASVRHGEDVWHLDPEDDHSN